MDKRIIIIHPSLIIRQGILALTRSRIDWEFIDSCDCAEIIHYRSIRNSIIIFLVDAALAGEKLSTTLAAFRDSNSIKTLYLSQDESLLASLATNEYISLNASKDQLLKMLDDHFGTINKAAPAKSAESMSLTERERDILKLVALGKSNKEMAHLLSISIHTVITHRKNITEKLNIKSISGLTVYAILNRLLDAENIDLESLI